MSLFQSNNLVFAGFPASSNGNKTRDKDANNLEKKENIKERVATDFNPIYLKQTERNSNSSNSLQNCTDIIGNNLCATL